MHAERFSDPAEFARLVVPALQTHEAENNLPIGIVNSISHGDPAENGPFMAVVRRDKDDGEHAIVAVAVCTPPFPVVVAYTPDAGHADAVAVITQELYSVYGADIVGFNSDTRIVGPYVTAWSERTGRKPEIHMKLRIYRCRKPKPPTQVCGMPRRVEDRDRDILRDYVKGFYQEAVPDEYDPKAVEAFVGRSLSADPERQGVLLWEADGAVVSMAAYTGPTPHGIRVNAVYTPPDHRRHGYASACVAELTSRLLHQGKEFCFLFTDLSNPTSNKIYQEIGYEPVSDHVYWKFV